MPPRKPWLEIPLAQAHDELRGLVEEGQGLLRNAQEHLRTVSGGMMIGRYLLPPEMASPPERADWESRAKRWLFQRFTRDTFAVDFEKLNDQSEDNIIDGPGSARRKYTALCRHRYRQVEFLQILLSELSLYAVAAAPSTHNVVTVGMAGQVNIAPEAVVNSQSPMIGSAEGYPTLASCPGRSPERQTGLARSDIGTQESPARGARRAFLNST